MTKTPNDSSIEHIDPRNPAHAERWTREFDVSEAQLTQAVAKVGDKAPDVELYLKGTRSSTNADTTHDAAPDPAP